MNAPKWGTPESRAEVKRLWLQGKSSSEIAKMLKATSRSAVCGVAHRLGLTGEKQRFAGAGLRGAALTDQHMKQRMAARNAEIVKRRRAGMGPAAISRELRVSVGAVEKAIFTAKRRGEVFPEIAKVEREKKPKADPVVVKIAETWRVRAFEPLPETKPGDIHALGRSTCRWPVGEDEGGVTRLFCCQPVHAKLSYCDVHARISGQVKALAA